MHTLLAAGAVEHVLLVGVARHQAVDGHLLRLADAVAARHGLQVVLRPPSHISVRSSRCTDPQHVIPLAFLHYVQLGFPHVRVVFAAVWQGLKQTVACTASHPILCFCIPYGTASYGASQTASKQGSKCWRYLRVPVGVIDNDRVGGGQRDALAASARGQQERKAVRPLCAMPRPVALMAPLQGRGTG